NYAPELKGQFQLHYFLAERSLVQEGSLLECSAVVLVKRELLADPAISQEFKDQYCRELDDRALIPVHPHQAEWLLSQTCTQEWLKLGQLRYLGAQGRAYSPTSSIRTVYHSESEYMLKLSLQVKITNSMRLNKKKELIGGLEGSRLLKHCIPEFRQLYPDFEFIHDPAYLTLVPQEGMQESGFELVIRNNPFRGEGARDVTLIAALVQDPLPGCRSRLAVIMEHLAAEEGRSVAQVSLDWFRQYMRLSLRPMVWLYLKYGIALEAHQQNGLIRLSNGYPVQFYYRDNQGYYYCRSMVHKLNQLLPGIGGESRNLYDDSIVDERFRYYLIVNHMFGMINGFGLEGLIDERLLLAELRSVLESFLPMNRHSSCFLDSLLKDKWIPCKANLLTRLIDMDELDSELEQAVYVNIDNPLVKELPSRQIIHKAKQVTFLWRQDAELIGSGQA
ncbi:MAG: Petrobactin biosynthesis protein AsbA, partial [Paenibacillus sp.]|nr:Petrobactin biosynthesis protein AsbA [Paenibacillus sp.]